MRRHGNPEAGSGGLLAVIVVVAVAALLFYLSDRRAREPVESVVIPPTTEKAEPDIREELPTEPVEGELVEATPPAAAEPAPEMPEDTIAVLPSEEALETFSLDLEIDPAAETNSLPQPELSLGDEPLSEMGDAEALEPDKGVEETRILESAPPIPVNLDELALNRTEWPPTVTLLKAVSFPVVINGRTAGEATVPAGTKVRLTTILGLDVELEHAGGLATIPAASTDLERLIQAARLDAPGEAAPPPPSAAAAGGSRESKAATPDFSDFKRRVRIDVSRDRKTRTDRGIWYSKTDVVKVKMLCRNNDPGLAFEDLKATFYLLAESQSQRDTFSVLSVQSEKFSLPARGRHEWETDEVRTTYQSAYGSYGYKFSDWVLVITNRAGENLYTKSSSPSLEESADQLASLKEGLVYDRNFKRIERPPF